MKRSVRRLLAALLAGTMAVSLAACAPKSQPDTSAEFQPKLDTETNVTLDCSVFFGNFEALDQVIVDFNQLYPNVTVSYEQVGSTALRDYLDKNHNVDLFMTSDTTLDPGDEGNVLDFCANLSKETLDLSAIDPQMLPALTVNGQLRAIPMGQKMYGMVVNTSLLEREGLEVPQDFESLCTVVAALKEKGYTPIQGPNSKVYAELTGSMAYSLIGTDPELPAALLSGAPSAADAFTPVFQRLQTLLDLGVIDAQANDVYPDDNYDGSILRFFQGDVPFWVCETEKVSGMKKRESKSEEFSANPFTYTFVQVPLGDGGAYAYSEPWYGFAVSKDSDNYDYAMEFLRFLATRPELNQLADIKGVPSVDTTHESALYADAAHPVKTECSYVNQGVITSQLSGCWYVATQKFARGELATPEEAAQFFVRSVSELGAET